MAVDVKRVLREKPGSFLAYFLPLLVLAGDNVELIDVLELYGFDRLAEALERLGGSRVIFPTWATLDALVKDAYLVSRFESLYPVYQDNTGRPKAETKAALELEFEVPYELLFHRVRTVKDLLRRVGSSPVPGEKEAAQYLKRMQRTNGEIKRAIEQQEDNPWPKEP